MFRVRMVQVAIVAGLSVGGTIFYIALCTFLDLL
jgi:hypothetical protein